MGRDFTCDRGIARMESIIKAEVNLTSQEEEKHGKLSQKFYYISHTRSKHQLLNIIVFLLAATVMLIKTVANGQDWFDFAVSLFILLFYLYAYDFLQGYAVKRGWIKDNKGPAHKPAEFNIQFNEDSFSLQSANPEKNVNRSYPYDKYVFAKEQQDVFYLHAGHCKDFIIPKRCITRGSPETLADFLHEKLGNNFLF